MLALIYSADVLLESARHHYELPIVHRAAMFHSGWDGMLWGERKDSQTLTVSDLRLHYHV